MKISRLFFASSTLLALALGVPSCGGGGSPLLPPPGGPGPGGTAPSVTANNQLVDFGGTPQVTLASVRSAGAGWAVVFDDAGGGTPGTLRGMTQVANGLASNVAVTLNAAAVQGGGYVVQVYDDQAPTGVFGAEDMPQMNGGNPVQDTFTVDLPTVVMDNQSLSLTTVVTLATVRSFGNGWITIHPDSTGNPDLGTTLGALAVGPGTSSSATVELTAPLLNAQTFHAVLRIDQGTIGGTVEGGDTVVMDNSAMNVTDPAVATVAAGTPDVRLTFGSNGTNDWQLTAVTPTTLADTVVANPMTDLGNPGGNDVAITLVMNMRYEISNMVAGSHPFQFINQASGGSAGSDTVLLGQSIAGTLEADAEINWVEVNSSTLRFTVDADFKAGVLGYRCGVHTTMMRGDVTVP